MKKSRIITWSIIGATLLTCFHLFLWRGLDEDRTYEGLDQFVEHSCSHIGLNKYLTLRDEEDSKTRSFLDEFRYSKGYFWAHLKRDGQLNYETSYLSLSYSPEIYQDALNRILAEPGYYYDSIFEYNSFVFALNHTRYYKENVVTWDYDLTSEHKYLHHINLVGYNNSQNRFIFIGFFYCKYRSLAWDEERAIKYSFQGWDAFFTKWYKIINWNE